MTGYSYIAVQRSDRGAPKHQPTLTHFSQSIEPNCHIRLAISVHLLAHILKIDNTLLTVSDDIVESVELEESNSDVAELDYHVEDEQIVSVSLTNHTTSLSCSLSHTGQASISVLTSVSYIQQKSEEGNVVLG